MQVTREAMDYCRAFIRSGRRRSAGSIDVDFYRARAFALRRHAMCQVAALKTLGTVVVAACGFAAFLVAAAAGVAVAL